MEATTSASSINISSIIAASESCGNSSSDRKKEESILHSTLQTALTASSQQLEELLEKGEVDIVNLTRNTAIIEEQLAAAKGRLLALRSSLLAAKEKLMGDLLEEGSEKRTQFLAAYREDRANQATLELLVRVEKLVALPETVKANLESGQTLRAEEGVLKGLHQLEQGDEYGPLVEVEALREVHSALLEYQKELTSFSSSDEMTTSTLDSSTEADDAGGESSVPRYIQLPMLPASEEATSSASTMEEASNSSISTSNTATSSFSSSESLSSNSSSSEVDYSKYFAKRSTVLQQASDHLEHLEEAITSIINNTSIKFSAN